MALDFSAETMNLIVRLLVSALLGAAIGFERDIHGRAAGLRTHLLVCAGSALFMIISEVVARHYNQGAAGIERSDPTRIAAQVVTGIGFLGAGTILKEGLTIRGLTTAACLWFVAGLGMACGAGLFALAFYATVLGLFCLISLNYLERTYRKDSYRTIIIQTHNSKTISEIIDIVKRKNVDIAYCDYKRDYETDLMTVKLSLRLFHKGITDKLSHTIVRDLENAQIALKSIDWHH